MNINVMNNNKEIKETIKEQKGLSPNYKLAKTELERIKVFERKFNDILL
jgi:hypothetical protein